MGAAGDSGSSPPGHSEAGETVKVRLLRHSRGVSWAAGTLSAVSTSSATPRVSIGRYTRDLRRSAVDSLIESAFSVWARASGLTFVKTHTPNADIMVEFVTYAHGDFYPFDGPRGTLAHAFGPGMGPGGDTHFDDDERWTAGGAGFNLFVVAAHEFGHALGLKHSRNPDSLMYPTYKPFRPSNLLSREDAANIKAMYTPLRVHRNWPLRPLSPRLIQDKCAPDLTFDAVATFGNATFFFRDSYNENRKVMDFGYPRSISEDFPGVNTKINAAFYKGDFIYFFVGPEVYKFDCTHRAVVSVEEATSWLGC